MIESAAKSGEGVNPNRYPKHDDPAKGQFYGGECNRTACKSLGATFWNMGTYGLYCHRCAMAINAASPDSPKLCIELGFKPALADHETVKRDYGYYL